MFFVSSDGRVKFFTEKPWQKPSLVPPPTRLSMDVAMSVIRKRDNLFMTVCKIVTKSTTVVNVFHDYITTKLLCRNLEWFWYKTFEFGWNYNTPTQYGNIAPGYTKSELKTGRQCLTLAMFSTNLKRKHQKRVLISSLKGNSCKHVIDLLVYWAMSVLNLQMLSHKVRSNFYCMTDFVHETIIICKTTILINAFMNHMCGDFKISLKNLQGNIKHDICECIWWGPGFFLLQNALEEEIQ